MHVLDHEQRRALEQLREHRLDDAVQARAPEGRLELLDLLRRLDVDVERQRDERQPRDELGVELRDALAQGVRGGAVLRQLEQRAQQAAEGEVRRRGLVLRAGRRDGEQVRRLRLELLDEPRLAHAGLADQLDQVAEAHPHRRERGREDRQLALAADERQPVLGSAAAVPETATTSKAVTGSAIPFSVSGSSSTVSKVLRERSSRSLVVSTWPGSGLAHQPRGERGRLAEDRVGAPEARTDLAGEDAAAGGADPERQLGREVGDPARGSQNALLVLARRLGRAGDEDHLAAVGVDVGLEEGDAVLVGHPLRARDQLVEHLGHAFGAGVGEQGVDAAEMDERDRGLPVLGLGATVRDHAADRRGNAGREIDALERRQRLDPAARPGSELQQTTALLGLAENLVGERRRGLVADEDLAGLGARLHRDGARDAGPGQQQLAVRLTDEEEVVGVGVDADVHLQLDRPDRGLRLSELLQRRAHPVGGIAGTGGVVLAREEEQQRVAAELEQPAAEGVGDVEQALEGAVHHLRHLLGAELALLREPLVQRGEAGDVDEGERPLEPAVSRLGLDAQPVDDDARDERRQVDER